MNRDFLDFMNTLFLIQQAELNKIALTFVAFVMMKRFAPFGIKQVSFESVT